MSRLFAELYADEDVSVFIAELLRVRGFAVRTTDEVGLKETDDDEQLKYAVDNCLTILTHNRDDFAALAQSYFASGKKHYGTIIAVRRPPHQIVERLLTILNRTTADEMEDQVIYI